MEETLFRCVVCSTKPPLLHHRIRRHERSVVRATALQDTLGVEAAERDVVDHHHQRELRIHLRLTPPSRPHLRVDQHVVHLLARRCALQLLPVQHLLLQLLPRLHLTSLATRHLLRAHERLRAAHVAAAPARGDQVRHARALEEGVVLGITTARQTRLHALIEHLGELLHLHQTNANQRRLRVRPVAQRVHEARAQRDHVLERATELHAHGVVHQRHAEVRRVEQHLQLLRVVAHAVAGREEEEEQLPQSYFGELAGGDLIRHVGAAEDGAVDVELVVDHAGD